MHDHTFSMQQQEAGRQPHASRREATVLGKRLKDGGIDFDAWKGLLAATLQLADDDLPVLPLDVPRTPTKVSAHTHPRIYKCRKCPCGMHISCAGDRLWL